MAVVSWTVPKDGITVVLDAGHGGRDGGVIGVNSRAKESDINLEIVKILKGMLERLNYNVVLTRETEDDLGANKSKDMSARKNIILNAKPHLVVSVHCNKFPDKNRRGAQVFFDTFSERGASLAKLIQTNLNAVNTAQNGRSFNALRGDYYILKCSPFPSAIVECGFLSNPEDDKLLNTHAYRVEIAEGIARGIQAFLLNVQA